MTYLRDWELWRLNLADLKEERMAWREPSRKGGPIYSEPATWSPDGKHLVVCIGEDANNTPSLAPGLSPARVHYRVEDLSGEVWSPIPRPFIGR